MNKTIAAVFASLALLVGIPTASAKVTVFATDTMIGTNTAELQITIDVFRTGKKYFDPDIVGGFIKVFSGNGQEQTIKIPKGENTETFTVDFIYDQPGVYTPSFKGIVFYSELFKDKKRFDDDFFCKKDDCGRFDIDKVFKFDFVRGDFPAIDPVAAAPELSTWAMMLMGFAAIGFVAYRRARKTTSMAIA